MTEKETAYLVARELLEVFPGLGRLISVRMRDSVEEDTTLMQIGVLMRLKDQAITTSDLAKMRKVSLQSASVLVQGLVERGWVTRAADPDDRRRFLLQVTPEGVQKAEATQEQITRLLADVLADLNPEEVEAASIFLPALRRAIATQMTSESTPES